MMPTLGELDQDESVPSIAEEITKSSSSSKMSSSYSSRQSNQAIPEGWAWIYELMQEAHLPKLGLPVRWEATEKKHIRIAFDPETNIMIHIDTGVTKKHKISPIGFIESTLGKTPMPGTDTPASARLTRYLEPCFNEHFIRDARGEILVPCIAHGDYVKVESLQTDHAQAKEEIQQRQHALVARLNDDAAFASFVMQLDGMGKFFVKVNDQYYGTLFFYELYFNDIDNLWLICGACNLHKSNEESVAWFKDQWLYGDEFLNDLGKLKDPIILAKTQSKQGLGEVAIQWYWDRHANYASISKRLIQDVVTPIQILNQRVDRVVGLVRAGSDERRLQRHLVSLDFRVALLSEIAKIKGIDMPRSASESPHSSSDEENYMKLIDEDGRKIPVTLETYELGTAAYLSSFGNNVKSGVLDKILDRYDTNESASKRLRPGGNS